MSGHAPADLIDDFVQTLVDCRQLYLNAGRDCCHEMLQWGNKSPRELMEWMDDLHRGLLIKVYMQIALADLSWQPAERDLAQRLFEHLWNRRLQGDALREAAQELHQRAQRLSLRGVLLPFLEFDFLREQSGELATIVLRLANLIAKADGVLTSAEAHRLRQLQEMFDRIVESEAAGATRGPIQAADRRQVIQRLEEDAAQVPRPPALPSVASLKPQVAQLHAEPQLEIAQKRVAQLVGLAGVKREIQTLTNFLKVQQQRQQADLPRTPLSLHLVFVGNPGTGKTTVARIVGQIYGAMGVLAKGHLVETDRSGLVAEYAGQTAMKTNQLIDSALDGILFIDEAYSLVAETGEDAFGREALQTLLKRMEDDRDRLAVILAGYPQPMSRLLRSNPGLMSRFSRTLSFEDYDCVELAQIFHRLCEQNHYVLSPQVRSRLLLGLKWLHHDRDEHFGNGRLIRNVFEDAIRHLANRIANTAPLTRQLLTEFEPGDLRFPSVPADLWERFPAESTAFQTQCPGCQRSRTLTGALLGRRVRCPACQQTFAVDWAEPQLNPRLTA